MRARESPTRSHRLLTPFALNTAIVRPRAVSTVASWDLEMTKSVRVRDGIAADWSRGQLGALADPPSGSSDALGVGHGGLEAWLG